MDEHVGAATIEAGLGAVRDAPRDRGAVVLVVRRPAPGEREVLAEGLLTEAEGLVGDGWSARPSRRTPDGGPHPEMQLNLTSARFMAIIAPEDRRPLAGDQLHVDLDLSEANLPPGTRLRVGTATIKVTAEPHRGCAKYTRRFGLDALRAVNSPEGVALNLRGINARVVVAGTVRPGDPIEKLPAS